MNKQLARIASAGLSIKERGILTFWIFVEYEQGGHQGVGGLALDEWSEQHKRRIGTAAGCELIRQVLICLDVDDFREMTGRDIWVLGEGTGLSFEPRGIQALRADGSGQVVFKEVFDEFASQA